MTDASPTDPGPDDAGSRAQESAPRTAGESIVRPASTASASQPAERGPFGLLKRFTVRHQPVVQEEPHQAPPPPPAPLTHSTEISLRSPFAIGFFATMGALLAVGLMNVLISLQSIILIVVLSLFISLGLNPMVEWLSRRRIPRGLAVVLVMVGVLVIVSLATVALLPVVSEQATQLYKNTPAFVQSLRENEQLANLDAQYHFISRIQEFLSSGNLINLAWNGILGAGKAVANVVFTIVVTMVLTTYFLASLPQIKGVIYALAPASRRERVRYLADEIFASVGGYVSGMTIDVIIAGVVFAVFLFVVGLGEYALAVAFMVALLTYIPLIGGFINIVLVTLIGLTQNPTTGIVCLAFCIVYQQVDAYFTQPRLLGRSVQVPGALVVVAALAGGTSAGIAGAVMAVPITASLLIIYREVVIPTLDAR